MGNVCCCGRASSPSDSDAQYRQLLRDLRDHPDISWDNLDSLMDCMDFIFSKLKQPNEASSSSSSERVAQSATIGRSIVRTLSTQIESEVRATTSKCPGIGRISGSRMKQYVSAALNSRTMKLVGDVLDKTQKIPYIGVASAIVVYLLEQYEKSSSNVEQITNLLEHLYDLVKCLKELGLDENANQMLRDMLGFIVKCTVSLDQHINQSSIKRFAFAYPNSTELQSMRNDLMLKYQNTQLKTLMDIYRNTRRLPQAPSKVYCASDAVGTEGAMEEVKKKLNMGGASKKVVIIWGMGGIGKTTLGDHVYNSVVDKSKYSHCRLEMDIKSTTIPKLQFDLLSQVFQEREEVLNAREGQGRISKAIEKSSKQSQSKPLLLYIDNASIKGEVDDLLPVNTLTSLPEGSRIMVTTRNLNKVETWKDIPGFEFEEFRMEEIPRFEAKKILSYYALRDENGSFDEDVDVDVLLDLCMGVPLLIEMAAKKLRNLNSKCSMGMAEACRNVIEHMQNLKNGEGWENDVMDRMVDFVYGQLPESYQRIFLDIVFFFINWRRYKVVCIFGEIVIGELEGAGLLSTNQKGRLKVHDIIKVRAHAISKGSRICDREEWERLKTNAQDFNEIVGLHIDVKEDDLEYVGKCDKLKILILKMPMRQEPVKEEGDTSRFGSEEGDIGSEEGDTCGFGSEWMVERMLGGGGGGEYWRMEGDDDLVREDGHSWQGNNAAIIMTGLNLVSQECREAVHRMAEEGREIIYVDTGISRWKRFEAAYEEQGRAFSGEVELNEDDKQMMKGMLKQLQLPNECVPRVWTSPFPKDCISLSAILCNHTHSESGVLKSSSVGLEQEFSEEYDKERSCQFEEVVVLPSLGIPDASSEGLYYALGGSAFHATPGVRFPCYSGSPCYSGFSCYSGGPLSMLLRRSAFHAIN